MAFLATALGLAAAGWMSPAGVSAAPPPRDHTEQHDAAEHAKESAALRAVFDGNVDVYFDAAQLSGGKPGVSGVKFVDIVDVTGKALLRFEKDTERWLIDPDTVLAFKCAHAK